MNMENNSRETPHICYVWSRSIGINVHMFVCIQAHAEHIHIPVVLDERHKHTSKH